MAFRKDNVQITDGVPSQRAGNAESVRISWRHRGKTMDEGGAIQQVNVSVPMCAPWIQIRNHAP